MSSAQLIRLGSLIRSKRVPSSLFFYSFALHENARELHAYTRQQKKGGNDFDGELDNFQEPKLSSLWKLVRLLYHFCPLISADLYLRSEHGRDI